MHDDTMTVDKAYYNELKDKAATSEFWYQEYYSLYLRLELWNDKPKNVQDRGDANAEKLRLPHGLNEQPNTNTVVPTGTAVFLCTNEAVPALPCKFFYLFGSFFLFVRLNVQRAKNPLRTEVTYDKDYRLSE